MFASSMAWSDPGQQYRQTCLLCTKVRAHNAGLGLGLGLGLGVRVRVGYR